METVLPTEGIYCIGTLHNKAFKNFYGDNLSWAEETSRTINDTGRDTYFALASFKEKGSRTQDNVLYLKSFWLDIDTQESKPAEPYANRKVAVQELVKFCAAVGLPQPMLVSSGYGIHAYWPLTENVDALTWKVTATLLKQACRVWGLAADASRTSDSASVLRPVGMHNFKMDAPKEVKLLKAADPITFDTVHGTLVAYLEANKAMPSVPLPKAPNINSDLMSTPAHITSSAHKIAKHCGVIQKLRDTAGDLPQPEWYYSLQVVAFTEEGDELCHEWSKGYPQYDPRETQSKIDQAKKYAPTSCQKLREYNEEACAACPHFGKIKSPIVLGTEKHEPQYIQVPGQDVSNTPLHYLPMMPKGFGWGPINNEANAKSFLWGTTPVKVEREDGTTGWEHEKTPITDTLFFPIARVQNTDKTHCMLICFWRPDGTQDEFLVDNSLAVDSRELQKELARREIITMNHTDKLLQDYVKGWITNLRDNLNITKSSTQFGWDDDGNFCLGDRIITPEGEKAAILTGTAFSLAKHLRPKGSFERWKELVNLLYNHKGLEHHQYCILASFASPLIQMMNIGAGLIYAYSALGGDGKSTAQQVGFSVWGNTKKGDMIISRDGFTKNAIETHMGLLNNLPLVIDELSQCPPEFTGDLLYAIENGAGKKRMKQDLTMNESLNWCLIGMASGNRKFSEKALSYNPECTPHLMRLFEFVLEGRPPFVIPSHEADVLTAELLGIWGHAGPVYAKYLVENREAVKQRMLDTRAAFSIKYDIKYHERFWSAMHSAVLLAQEIAAELELVTFDRENLENWIASELEKSRNLVETAVSSPIELLTNMLADFAPNLLVTVGEGNLYGANPDSAQILKEPMSKEIWGRHVLPAQNCAERLTISTAKARKWCATNNVSWDYIKDAMLKDGIFKQSRKKGDNRVPGFGRGVSKYRAQDSSLSGVEIDLNKLRAQGGNLSFGPTVQVVPSGPAQDTAVDMTGTA